MVVDMSSKKTQTPKQSSHIRDGGGATPASQAKTDANGTQSTITTEVNHPSCSNVSTPAESPLASDDILALDNNYVVVGKIGRTHGLKGMVFIHSFTEPKENLFAYTALFLGNKDPLSFSSHQNHAKQIIAQINNYDNVDSAKNLSNKLIYLHTNQLPTLPKDQYYWHELTGCEIINQQDHSFGIVDYIYAGPQFPIMVIKNKENPRKPETLIPYEPSVVTKVLIQDQKILVDWIIDE